MKSRDGKSQRRAEKKKEDQNRESLRRKKIQVREKVGKSRNTVFFQWFVASEGRKVGSLKRRVRSPLGRWEMKNCTPLWREAQLEVKMHKTHRSWTTFGSWNVEKVHAVVARSTFPSQSVGPLLEVDMSKKCTPLWREAHFEVKMYKTHRLRSTFGSWDVEKCTPLWREAHIQVKTLKAQHARTTFEGSDVVLRGRCQGFYTAYTAPKMSKTWGFWSISQNDGRHGTFEEDLERCISRGRRSARDMFVRAVRRSGRWFPERGGTLEHEIFGFGKMILCDRCSTSYDLASLFRDMDWRNRKTHWYEAVSSALNFPLLKEVSQNCFVFDVANFKNWESLAELLRFWCCQVKKLRKSRRLAAFLMLSSSEIEEALQSCFVLSLQIDR